MSRRRRVIASRARLEIAKLNKQGRLRQGDQPNRGSESLERLVKAVLKTLSRGKEALSWWKGKEVNSEGR